VFAIQPLVIIIGPTAVGKSDLGVDLALAVGGEIISGDSVQVYRKLNIGSAKPTKAEQKGVVHHLLDFLDPAEPFTAARFQTLSRELIQTIRNKKKIPIIVGGTGLYIRSLTDGYAFPEEGSEKIKDKWFKFAAEQGNEQLYRELAKRDPATAAKLHFNDTARIVRALEVQEITGRPLSDQRSYQEKNYPPLEKSVVYIGLDAPRELIYQRINTRCEDMVQSGLIEETAALLREGYSPKLKPLQSIGYRHALYYLAGKVNMQEMLRIFQRDSRHFAKRQLTWFRRDPRIKWFDISVRTRTDIIAELKHTCALIQTSIE